MGLAEVKKELKKLDKDKLITVISDLYKMNKSVQEFLDHFANPDENMLFGKYRQKVYEAFYPKRGYDFKLKDGKQAISDFKKLAPSAELVADLMLFYVETGVEFTNDFGDINEAFYSSIETTYAAALKLMEKENLLDKFADRAEMVIVNLNEIGWGFEECLSNIYSNYYS
jgi:hypothetical protein